MKLSFADYLERHSWLTNRGHLCIASPDIDGLLCALITGAILDWKWVGFHDGKKIVFWTDPQQNLWPNAVFLDFEVLRPDVRSVGNHLLTFDKSDAARLEKSCPGLMNPNLRRGIHFDTDFARKYPFGTLLILYSAFAFRGLTEPDPRHLAALYYPDSGLEKAMIYKDNALDWLAAMGAAQSRLAPLCRMISEQTVFGALNVLSRMQEIVARSGFGRKEKAARFDPENPKDRKRAARLADLLSEMTGWKARLPLNTPPCVVKKFETRRSALDAKGRARKSFEKAHQDGALSLAATGRTSAGLSYTVPSKACSKFADLWY